MIRIGIDGNEANVEKRVGVSVYALNLLKYFRKMANRETQFNIYLKNPPLNDLPKENKYFRYQYIPGKFLWSQISLPLYLYSHKNIDVYFSPAHYLPRFCPAPQVVTIHDLAYLHYPEDFTKKDFYQLKNWTSFSIKKTKKIIAVSKTTKKDIIKNYQIDENKIQVIYNGYEKQSPSFTKVSEGKQKFNLELKNKEPFILFVGTIQPRKNLETLIDAFNKFIQINKDFKLVIVGKKGWLYKNIFEKVKTMKLEDKIIFTDHVTDEELIWYYKNAFCLVLPSFYEGFGIPVLEAMNFDCPVVASYSSSLPEIGGDASLYFDPKNPDDLLEKLNSLKQNQELRKELITKGRQRIKDFSWEKCGRETLDVIKQGRTLPEGPTLIIPDDFSPSEYNKQVFHPLQSWEWGEARKKTGVEVLRLGDGKNVYQLTIHQLPITNHRIGYLPRSVFPTKDVLDFLYDYGKKNKIVFIKIEPYEEKSKIKDQRSKTQIKDQKLIKSKHPLFPEWTQILDLNKSEDELLKSFHHKTRYNIRLAEKKGVVIKEMSNDYGFEIFSKLYFETCKRQKYFGHTPKYHQIVWDSLKKDIIHILIAFYNETPLAAYELFYFKNILYYPYGGTSLEYRNFMASNLLMWEAIKLGKKLGAEKFDMWGSLPPNYDANNPWSGFTRFKEGYGTKFVEFVGSFDLVINKNLYHLYNFANKLRENYLKLSRFFLR